MKTLMLFALAFAPLASLNVHAQEYRPGIILSPGDYTTLNTAAGPVPISCGYPAAAQANVPSKPLCSLAVDQYGRYTYLMGMPDGMGGVQYSRIGRSNAEFDGAVTHVGALIERGICAPGIAERCMIEQDERDENHYSIAYYYTRSDGSMAKGYKWSGNSIDETNASYALERLQRLGICAGGRYNRPAYLPQPNYVTPQPQPAAPVVQPQPVPQPAPVVIRDHREGGVYISPAN